MSRDNKATAAAAKRGFDEAGRSHTSVTFLLDVLGCGNAVREAENGIERFRQFVGNQPGAGRVDVQIVACEDSAGTVVRDWTSAAKMEPVSLESALSEDRRRSNLYLETALTELLGKDDEGLEEDDADICEDDYGTEPKTHGLYAGTALAASRIEELGNRYSQYGIVEDKPYLVVVSGRERGTSNIAAPDEALSKLSGLARAAGVKVLFLGCGDYDRRAAAEIVSAGGASTMPWCFETDGYNSPMEDFFDFVSMSVLAPGRKPHVTTPIGTSASPVTVNGTLGDFLGGQN